MLGNRDGAGSGGPLFQVYGKNSRNHFPRFFDGDEIAHPDVLAGNLLEIMKGGPRDGGAAEQDGFQFRDRGDDTGAADLKGHGMEPGFGVQAGAQHESNGQALPKSRSLNTFYFKPTVAWELPRGWQLSISPRLIGYVDMDENPDLERYRGSVEWTFGAEHRDGFKFTAGLRKGTGSGYGSAELNASWPLDRLFPELGGRVLLQYFNGWGESLLDYNVRRADQFRLGFMVVP